MPKTSNIVQLNAFDPEQVNQRLYKQVSVLLGQLEEKDSKSKVTMRERIAALIAVGRLQGMFVAMRKASGDVASGSTVKKYASTFTNAARGRTKNAGPADTEPEPSDWFERADRDDDDDLDAS
jgi:hypothetical protein